VVTGDLESFWPVPGVDTLCGRVARGEIDAERALEVACALRVAEEESQCEPISAQALAAMGEAVRATPCEETPAVLAGRPREIATRRGLETVADTPEKGATS
jgi:hypothetical protein